MSATCDYGTQGCYRISYVTMPISNTGTVRIPHTPPPRSAITISYTCTRGSRTRRRRIVGPLLPFCTKCFYAREGAAHDPGEAPLAPKTAARSTQVAWTRGRPPQGLSLRTLRLLGTGLRR